jgi:two-component system, OmpR family, response regulator
MVLTGSILVVDDEPEMRSTLVRYLISEGFSAMPASDGLAMNKALQVHGFDLVILDLGLRNETGLDLLRKLRETQDIAVIILTGKSDPIDKVVGLELGADDYITKPFLNRELLARINAVLRRTKTSPAPLQGESRHVLFNDWRIDLVARTLAAPDGRSVQITTAEFNILVELVEHAGKAVTRERLMDVAHHRAWTAADRSIDIHVHNLRKKLSSPASGSDIIVAVRNIGYVLAAEVSTPAKVP